MAKSSCSKCKGSGKCLSCQGTGNIEKNAACRICFGTGNCSKCSGSGSIGNFKFEVHGENADEVAKVAEALIEKGVKEITSNPSINTKLNNNRTRGKMHSILFLAADPTDASRLRLGQELREIQEKLNLAKLRDLFVLNQRMSVRPTDISQAFLDFNPKIVHFSGHGMATGELCFEDEIGNTLPIQPDALADLFEQFTDQIKCVILNACFSENQANAIVKHIDYVIGMNKAIGDKAAIAFAIGFYQALGAGRSVVDAFKLARVQIKLHGISESLTPVLVIKENAPVFQASIPDILKLNESTMDSLKMVDTKQETILVYIVSKHTGQIFSVSVPLDMIVGYAINELIKLLKFPLKFENSWDVPYNLYSKLKGKKLESHMTFRQNGVMERDTLSFHIDMLAG